MSCNMSEERSGSTKSGEPTATGRAFLGRVEVFRGCFGNVVVPGPIQDAMWYAAAEETGNDRMVRGEEAEQAQRYE